MLAWFSTESTQLWNFWSHKAEATWDFPGGPMVKTPCFHCRGRGSIPGRGTKIPHATWRSQKTEKQTNKKKAEATLLVSYLGSYQLSLEVAFPVSLGAFDLL